MSDIIKIHGLEKAEEENLFAVSLDDLSSISDLASRAKSERQRFALVIDATSSMDPWWYEAKTALKKAVDEIKEKTSCPFQIKVRAYRDHTCDMRPLEESEWSSDTEYLKSFIERIRATGGGDEPESIGHGLSSLAQQGTNSVILIGDAHGRPESQGYVEAQELGHSECPVYGLYVSRGEKVKTAFERIARLSGGKAIYLGSTDVMEDVIKAILASNKKLMITYQPTSIEGKKVLE